MTRSPAPSDSGGRLLLNDAAVVVATVVCAMITWLMVSPVAGVDLQVGTGDRSMSIGAGSVALTAAAAAVAGLLVLRGLERFSANGLRIWTALAIILALLSLLGPLGAVSAAATGSLLALHAVVATVLIVGGYRAHRRRPTR